MKAPLRRLLSINITLWAFLALSAWLLQLWLPTWETVHMIALILGLGVTAATVFDEFTRTRDDGRQRGIFATEGTEHTEERQ